MLRRTIAVLFGISVAVAVFVLVEKINQNMYPFPVGMDIHDHHAMASYIANLPSKALLIDLAGWIFGSIICGFLIGYIDRSNNKISAYIGGLFLMTSGIVDLILLPHPMWFIIMGMTVFIPFTLLGHTIVPNKSKNQE